MKNLLHFALVLFVALAFVGCDSNDDDNNGPTANADAATAIEGTATTIDVLANDTDPDDDDLTITAVGTPSNGEAVIANGAIVYTSDLGFSGQDSFTYTVSDGENTATGTVTVEVVLQLVGSWVSEGENVAPGLAGNPAFPTARIDADFAGNGTYEVVATSTDNVAVTFTGSYSVTATNSVTTDGETLYEIVLEQSTPATVTSRGIYALNAARDFLRYEVIQTEPEIQGFTPPTASAGFGSTAFNGTPLGATWIQQFVRIDA
jgi:hypothetical protein